MESASAKIAQAVKQQPILPRNRRTFMIVTLLAKCAASALLKLQGTGHPSPSGVGGISAGRVDPGIVWQEGERQVPIQSVGMAGTCLGGWVSEGTYLLP